MGHASESGQPEGPPRRRRRWYHPRKTDLAFVAGLTVFLVNGLRGGPVDPTIVYGSIALMGFAAAGRVDAFFGDDHPHDDHRGSAR